MRLTVCIAWLPLALWLAGCQTRSAAPPQETAAAPEASQPPAAAAPAVAPQDTAVWEATGRPTVTASGLRRWTLEEGTGAVAASGMTVSVHYVGRLEDGTVFDHSYGRGAPLTFQLGAGQVIPGWDEGLTGMKVGGRRKLVIPPAIAYGDRGAGGVIPPNATLVFQVTLVDAR